MLKFLRTLLLTLSFAGVRGEIDRKLNYVSDKIFDITNEAVPITYVESSSIKKDILPSELNENLKIELELARKISGFSNITELFREIVDNETILSMDSVYFGTSDIERSSVPLATSAICMPTPTVVSLVPDNIEPSTLYIPSCTRVKRCNGCCGHELLSCEPAQTEKLSLIVHKMVLTSTKKLAFKEKEIVEIEEHTKCKCDCRIKKEDCNSRQRYDYKKCSCICDNDDEKKKCENDTNKSWDATNCSCKCQKKTSCTTGSGFDWNSCECVQNRKSYTDREKYILPPEVIT